MTRHGLAHGHLRDQGHDRRLRRHRARRQAAGGPFTYTTTTAFRALQSSPDPSAGLGYTFLTPGAPGYRTSRPSPIRRSADPPTMALAQHVSGCLGQVIMMPV